MAQPNESIVEKIKKLLAKAEGTDNEHEAKIYNDKVAELMARYAVDAAMLRATSDGAAADDLVTVSRVYSGIYRQTSAKVSAWVANAMGGYGVTSGTSGRNATETVYIHGFRAEIEQIVLLLASLETQVETALQGWERRLPAQWAAQKSFAKFKDRRQFRSSFGVGVVTQIVAARDVAAAAAEKYAAPSVSVALAIRDSQAIVKQHGQEFHGTIVNRANRNKRGSLAASNAGYAAGKTADVGRTRIANRGEVTA